MKYLSLVITASLCIAASGCATCKDFAYQRAQRKRAEQAWIECGSPYQGNFAQHFRRGWIAGYHDVSMGSNGAPPPIPPHRYWDGPDRPAAPVWYQGYRCGVSAADRAGIAFCNLVPNSGRLRAEKRDKSRIR